MVSDDPWMSSKDEPPAKSGQEWVVIASFGNRHAAEHMLASLGHKFRLNAHKGYAEAFVISANADGSLKLTESRILEASGFAATTARVSVFLMAGLLGMGAMLKGAKATAHAAHKHQPHVGSNEERAHEILAQAGPGAAILLVRCKDPETHKLVAARAADQASYSWDSSMPDFLAALDPGNTHDWVRAALDQPTSAKT
jgi:hypothetical protein